MKRGLRKRASLQSNLRNLPVKHKISQSKQHTDYLWISFHKHLTWEGVSSLIFNDRDCAWFHPSPALSKNWSSFYEHYGYQNPCLQWTKYSKSWDPGVSLTWKHSMFGISNLLPRSGFQISVQLDRWWNNEKQWQPGYCFSQCSFDPGMPQIHRGYGRPATQRLFSDVYV